MGQYRITKELLAAFCCRRTQYYVLLSHNSCSSRFTSVLCHGQRKQNCYMANHLSYPIDILKRGLPLLLREMDRSMSPSAACVRGIFDVANSPPLFYSGYLALSHKAVTLPLKVVANPIQRALHIDDDGTRWLRPLSLSLFPPPPFPLSFPQHQCFSHKFGAPNLSYRQVPRKWFFVFSVFYMIKLFAAKLGGSQ